jgi:phosphoserine phosphatase
MRASSTVGLHIDAAKDALRSADAVCFDVDSTVITEEGIDVLAEYLGQYEVVANLTRAAMQGGMKFQDALRQRLEAMKPSRRMILDCIQHHPPTLTPGVAEVIAKLHARGTPVYLVSGGFRMMIEPIAERVGIAKDRIFANTILFDDSAEQQYVGFDANEMTSRDMGKPAAVQHLIDTYQYTTVVMFGDGATDAQAKPPATAFIGFGGVVVRETVKNASDWFITDFHDVIEILDE